MKRRFRAPEAWSSDYFRHPIFRDICLIDDICDAVDFPSIDELNHCLQDKLTTGDGSRIAFHVQDDSLPMPTLPYEERVYRLGVVATRERNWHDLFNAMIWVLYPASKLALNQAHMDELTIQKGTRRTKRRDTLTQFDECGVLLVCRDESVIQQLQRRQWQSLFADGMEALPAKMDWHIFGHALLEMYLAPFKGITSKVICMVAGDDYFEQDRAGQIEWVDRRLSAFISTAENMASPSFLSPLPLCALPGFWPDNESPDFFLDTTIFKPLCQA